MKDKYDDLEQAGIDFARLVFTNETYDECKKIIESLVE